MKENQESNVTLFNHRRKPFSVHIFTLMLMMALCLMSLKSNALAQSCIEQCQLAFASCLQAAQGDPALEVRCQDNFDRCGADCM